MVRQLKGSRLRRLINFWPPFLFAGIRSTRIDPDFRAIDVALVLRWFNRNEFTIDIRNANQELIARVRKTMYIRKKPQQRQPA